jgi:biopolymer transport protein ExbD
MKHILFFFIIFFTTIVNSNEKIITLATVNNVSITNVDLKDEMLILKVLNDSKKIDKNTLQQSAFQNLVDQAVRQVEVESNKIKISEQVNNQMYNSIKKKLTDNGIASTKILNKIKKKNEIDYAWNSLISMKYGWKINININEIDQRLIALGYIDPSNPDTIKQKNNLITQEKNKKFNFYSRNHLDLTKKKLLIKILK